MGDHRMGQDQIPILQPANLIEGRLADSGVAREDLIDRYGRRTRRSPTLTLILSSVRYLR